MLYKIVHWFERSLDAFFPLYPTSPPRTLRGFLGFYLGPAKWHLIWMMGLMVLWSVSEAGLLVMLGKVVDWFNVADRRSFWSANGIWIWASVAFLLVWMPFLKLLSNLVTCQSIMGNVPMIARWNMHHYVLGQSVDYFAKELSGRVATKVLQTALSLRDIALKFAHILVYAATTFVAIVLAVGQASWRTLAPFMLWGLLYGGIMYFFWPRMRKISKWQADERSKMTGHMVDVYTNMLTVKLFSNMQNESRYAKEGMQRFMQSVYRQFRMITFFDFAVCFNNMLLVCLVGWVLLVAWEESRVTLGEIALSFAGCLRLHTLSVWLMWEIGGVFEQLGVVHDGMESIAKPHAVTDKSCAVTEVLSADRSACTARGEGVHVAFEQVGFSYGGGKEVISDCSLEIFPGEKVGIVGHSGAGKSTLMRLLLRLYDVQSGCVKINGLDVRDLSQEALRKAIAVVGQEGMLLARSVGENIAYGQEEVCLDEIMNAAKKAGAWSFISELEDSAGRRGLEAMVGERGVMLSGGQRQRVAIARVFLKDAPLVILDEATSALDSEMEYVISEQIQKVMKNKTVMCIAHRLSTIAHMDRLIVLEKGRVIEQGSHADLLRNKGVYYRLWKRQSSGFLEQ